MKVAKQAAAGASGAPKAAGANATAPQSRRKLRHKVAPWLLLLPMVAMVMLALGYPLVRQTIMSFQEFGLAQQFGAPAEWVGFDNYKTILTDSYFWVVFVKSVLFCIWTAGLTMLLGVGLAVLMLRLTKAVRTFVNTVLIIVWAMPALATLTVWQWLVEPRSGLLNYFLSVIGLKSFEGFHWLGHNFWYFYLIASAIIIWQSLPLVTITIYAALAQVSPELLEAAQIDGASDAQQVVRIMLPIITPVIALIGVLQIIWDLRVFTQIYVLQQAGTIASETNLLGTYVYKTGIAEGNYGVASALAMVILLLTLLLTGRYLQMLYRQGGVE
ncbi:MAG: sugar ABC transporter permease [Actinomycetaceae bacterium]|nr:sugar ABC transporter permease [Actinomycetaceae bacterium]